MGRNNSLKRRFAGRENELREKVTALGLGYLCDGHADGKRVDYIAAHKYAKDFLGIPNASYHTAVAIEHVDDVAGAFVAALFKKFQAMENQIEQLRLENEELKDAENKKRMVAKLQLLRLTQALKE